MLWATMPLSTKYSFMYNTPTTTITHIVLHAVGNKKNDEPIALSPQLLQVNQHIKALLLLYFTSSFKENDHYSLHHPSNREYNEVYRLVSAIFKNPDTLHEHSLQLAKHLYEQSNHPKIKGGEFYVVYFKECLLEGEKIDGIGLFKSENKETFLNVYPTGNGFEIESRQGVNINKLDKGCLIFNKESESGYVVAVVDNTNKRAEAHYWMDHFLQLRKRQDNYYHTEQLLSMTKKFVTQALPQAQEVTKTEQVELLHKSLNFLKKNENFDLDEFAQEVIEAPEAIERFKKFKENYQQERELEIADQFVVSSAAVKRKGQGMKSVIKLDKNFQIHLNGGTEQYVVKGYDAEKGMHYYQLFFHNEE